ncbi:MAG: pantoate--beta-alanine ligase, partial [Proteiniphilum sp.]|nr:pantoate--beta-alanine ligase [Proteiniphilum sp.]
MEIVRTASGLDEMLQRFRLRGKTIGFVPTMGALHEG